MSNPPKGRVQCPKCMGNRYIPKIGSITATESCDRCDMNGWIEDTAAEPLSGKGLGGNEGGWVTGVQNALRPVRYLDGDCTQPQAIAMVPQESEHGYEPACVSYHFMTECSCFPDEYEKLKAAGVREIAIRIGTAENPCLRYAMFRPRSENGGFGECVARIPWTSENYHVPGICSRYHRPIVCNLRDYRFAIERGNYEEREAVPWPEPFVATHACTVCEWRGALSEAEPDADHKHVCPFCSQKNGRLRPIYEIEYEEPEPKPTGIEAMVCRDIAARQQMGITKYGRQLSESPDDMLQHAYEEALDLACYLKTLLQQRKVAHQATAEDRLLAEIFDDQGKPRSTST